MDGAAAADWYGIRSVTAALAFAQALELCILRVAEAPLLHPPRFGPFRQCKVRRFPYHVVYRLHDDDVVVVAVSHASRAPGW